MYMFERTCTCTCTCTPPGPSVCYTLSTTPVCTRLTVGVYVTDELHDLPVRRVLTEAAHHNRQLVTRDAAVIVLVKHLEGSLVLCG